MGRGAPFASASCGRAGRHKLFIQFSCEGGLSQSPACLGTKRGGFFPPVTGSPNGTWERPRSRPPCTGLLLLFVVSTGARAREDPGPFVTNRADLAYSSRSPKEDAMDTTTLLIIIVVLLLLGGGWYGRGRWY